MILEEIDNIKKALEVLDGELEDKWADFDDRVSIFDFLLIFRFGMLKPD